MKSLTRLLLLGSCLALSSTAWSIPLTAVGGRDTLIGQTTLPNSGAQTEIRWVEGVLGVSLDNFEYTQTSVDASSWTAVDDQTGVFALELAAPTDWFLIKIGNNSGSPDTHFLFDNSNLFAVIDLVSMGFSQRNISNIGKISHIAAGPAVTTVPESNSLALIGLGVLGLTLLRRRIVQPITK